jgi:hypothetical protein
MHLSSTERRSRPSSPVGKTVQSNLLFVRLFPSPSDRVRLDTCVADKEKYRKSVTISGDTKVLCIADRGYRRVSQTSDRFRHAFQGTTPTSGSRHILTRIVKNFHESVTGKSSFFGVWVVIWPYARGLSIYHTWRGIVTLVYLSGTVYCTFDENVFRGLSDGCDARHRDKI